MHMMKIKKKVVFFLIMISFFFYGTTLLINKEIFNKGINIKLISSIIEEQKNNYEKILVTDDRYYFYLKPDPKIELFPQHNLYDFAPKKISIGSVLNNKEILWVFSKNLNIKIRSQNNLEIYEFSTIKKKYVIEILNNNNLYEDDNTMIISGKIFKINY
tara:strand:+ start:79 stop:555 length:477 start_codon:yes stop_codon:yes gene_type:complete